MRLPYREGAAVPCPPEAPTLPTSPMTNGRSSSPSFPEPNLADVPELTKRERNTELHLLRAQGWMCLALAPARLLLALADSLPLLQGLAHRRHLGADTYRPTGEVAPPVGQRAYPKRG